ncbi:MAG: hypothetical protein GTN70_05610 [Deltaproteobacteria bacterium]|nr:hypothetical protein [Deltaproteobacteria bacterium]NIS77156.1 hypothetical protein [Deltaproteobacteria bacterium]
MAKVVSDNLIVRIAHKGEEKIVDLKALFNENPNRVISIVGTVNEDGTPNTAPMSLFYCPDDRTVVAGMVRTSRTVANIRREGKLIVEVIFGDDIAFGISGVGSILKDPLDCSDATLAIEIAVTGVKRDTSPAQKITSGAKMSPRSEKAVEYEQAVLAELVRLASSR